MKATGFFMMDTCRSGSLTTKDVRAAMMSRMGAQPSDGRVELQVAGEDEEVAAFLSAIRESTLGGTSQMKIKPRSKFPPFKGFRIMV